MLDQHFQEVLLREVRARTADHKTLVTTLSKLLYKSRYSIYKKLDGTTSLSIDECVRLAQAYHINLDPLIHGQESIVLNRMPCTPDSTASAILHIMERTLGTEDGHLWCLTGAAPHYHFAHYPALFTLLEIPNVFLMNEQMIAARAGVLLHDKEWQQTLQRIVEVASDIAITEFWNPCMLSRVGDLIPGDRSSAFSGNSTSVFWGDVCNSLPDIAERLDVTINWSDDERPPRTIYATKGRIPTNIYLITSGSDRSSPIEYFLSFNDHYWLSGFGEGNGANVLDLIRQWKRSSVCLSSASEGIRHRFLREIRRSIPRKLELIVH